MSLINVSNLSFGYDDSIDNVFENVSFQLDSLWKLGLIGRNGRGKTTFLKLLVGSLEYSGRITSEVKFEYFPYDVSDKSLNVIDVIKGICFDVMDYQIIYELSLLDLDESIFYKSFASLSYGEQSKVLLASLFLIENGFLLIDEPSNHLDIEGRKVVKNYLKRKSGFILVSHDVDLLNSCIDHVISINKKSIEIQKGNFDSWWSNKKLKDNYEIEENKKLKKDIKIR